MTGGLSVYQTSSKTIASKTHDKAEIFIHYVHPGEIVGGLAVLTGEASAYKIITAQPSRIALIRRPAIYQ